MPLTELGKNEVGAGLGRGSPGVMVLGMLHVGCRLDIPSSHVQRHQVVISDLENDT